MVLWISNEMEIRSFLLKGEIVAEEPVRVGMGRAESLTSASDLPVLKVSYGDQEIPLIPGSSWKGVFRSRVEAYLRSNGKKVCGGPGNTCLDRKGLKEKIEELLKKPSDENRKAVIDILSGELCMACKIFGAPGYISKVYLSDSYPIKHDGTYSFSLGVKPGIAIDRRTGAVRKGAFYNVEFVEPGSKFTFSLRARNLPNYALGLISKVILDLNNGLLRIGGFKTRGFGRISFASIAHEVKGIDGKIEGNTMRGFTNREKPWYDPEDEDVDFDGTTWGLVGELASLADRYLGR